MLADRRKGFEDRARDQGNLLRQGSAARAWRSPPIAPVVTSETNPPTPARRVPPARPCRHRNTQPDSPIRSVEHLAAAPADQVIQVPARRFCSGAGAASGGFRKHHGSKAAICPRVGIAGCLAALPQPLLKNLGCHQETGDGEKEHGGELSGEVQAGGTSQQNASANAHEMG